MSIKSKLLDNYTTKKSIIHPIKNKQIYKNKKSVNQEGIYINDQFFETKYGWYSDISAKKVTHNYINEYDEIVKITHISKDKKFPKGFRDYKYVGRVFKYVNTNFE